MWKKIKFSILSHWRMEFCYHKTISKGLPLVSIPSFRKQKEMDILKLILLLTSGAFIQALLKYPVSNWKIGPDIFQVLTRIKFCFWDLAYLSLTSGVFFSSFSTSFFAILIPTSTSDSVELDKSEESCLLKAEMLVERRAERWWSSYGNGAVLIRKKECYNEPLDLNAENMSETKHMTK